ncbi:hypothetical protein [Spirosoma oryzicola]|uniref:hypothetical protein n=1 Tax=Spirosoma oryzicola TaxID=2898794 RepID=UPI001E5D9EF4|nr:hypothetical protein [Spirosoma oryzicola]UHG90117.1 hypothetical protein LQ777_17915 [Spirosoma oryzicola]
MPLDSAPIESQIDAAFPDNASREIKPSGIRVFLKTLVRWVRDAVNNNLGTWNKVSDGQPGGANGDSVYRLGKTIFGRNTEDGSGATLQANTANFGSLNGLPAGQYFVVTNPAEPNVPATRFYAFAELPAATGGTYDFIDLTLWAKPWDGSSGGHFELNLYAANRGGFRFRYTTEGDMDNVGIVAYQQADGRTILYVQSDNAFRAITLRVNSHVMAVCYSAFTLTANLTGSLVLNTLNPTSYRPLQALRSRFTTFPVSNSDGALPPVLISEAGAGHLSLGANYVSGASDMAFISSNVAGSGFSFWQLLIENGSTVKKLLAYLNNRGWLALGLSNATSMLHLKAANGYQQLRLETKYTPYGPGDPNGEVGQVAWDDTWFYLKTAAGWRRLQLQSW